MKRRRNSAFTLIELIMVITITGIIAVIAIPKFISFRQEAEQAAEDATIGAVQSGITIYTAAEEARQ